MQSKFFVYVEKNNIRNRFQLLQKFHHKDNLFCKYHFVEIILMNEIYLKF